MKTVHVWKLCEEPSQNEGAIESVKECLWFYRCERCDVPGVARQDNDVVVRISGFEPEPADPMHGDFRYTHGSEPAPAEPTHPEWQYPCLMFGIPEESFEATIDWQDCDACLVAEVMES